VIIDPTDRPGAIGEWRFDPKDPVHAGWRDDHEAFVRTHRAGLVRFVARTAEQRWLAESEQSAENVAQVALTKAAFRWPQVREMDDPKKWVYRVAHNLVCTANRNRRVAREVTAVMPGWNSGTAAGPPVATAAAHQADAIAATDVAGEVVDRLAPGPAVATVADLPHLQRVAVYLTDVEGFRAAEVAEVLGCTPEKVASLLRGGRNSTRRRLALAARAFGVMAVVAAGAGAVAAAIAAVAKAVLPSPDPSGGLGPDAAEVVPVSVSLLVLAITLVVTTLYVTRLAQRVSELIGVAASLVRMVKTLLLACVFGLVATAALILVLADLMSG
jgi:DNA-directed RNA polymerase specialized sigma24 family protein